MGSKKIEEVKSEERDKIKDPKEIKNYKSQYKIEEFVDNSKSLGYSPLIIKTALKMGGKEDYTINEAKDILKKFK